ncbi:hypothetical protein BDA96_09G257600 [Sorghum bicolor]|uniref:Uncharacterized protein n=1 Tax=Sorghum bicolor TaxID=4558 RepID=A0A921QFH0_SORBI|nr:hypothetical protein BDA96_09G257600 [Sorghum bicolor]
MTFGVFYQFINLNTCILFLRGLFYPCAIFTYEIDVSSSVRLFLYRRLPPRPPDVAAMDSQAAPAGQPPTVAHCSSAGGQPCPGSSNAAMGATTKQPTNHSNAGQASSKSPGQSTSFKATDH